MSKQNVNGLVFDTETGKVTLEDGEVPAIGGEFTFENIPGYNPLQYATPYTAGVLIAALTPRVPSSVKFSAEKTKPEGPIQPPAAWQLIVENLGFKESFNAGLIANSIIRTQSIQPFLESLKLAGILI